MTEPLRIRIRSDWDAALTYDSLDDPPGSRAVFVGRDTLIAPLVAEIVEPNKRGTYLISGYRGTGKTTLLIEALSRAQKQLTKRDHKLFPVVLNVSEVSASLGSATAATPDRLDIDPRRLLIALLRTMAHRIGVLAATDPELKSLTEKANYAYDKATAYKYAQTTTRAQETTRSRSREFALALEDKNMLKTLALAAGAAAVAFETAAVVGPTLGWLHGAALALAAVFGVSLTASFRRSSSEKHSAGDQTAFEHDNSLQQLETDLKDILTALKKYKMRTVIVMEELDKIDDPEGRQLAAVIRYFKNLFTQAPALFFFVTDKSYFDIIASAIKHARRRRSYAVEHTFFTHRLFVGRPTTEESLQFISAIALDKSDRNAVADVAKTLGKPGRIDEADLFGLFVRCVLFSAANHLFNLKNELRRFVRKEDEQQNGHSASSFLIDEQTLPPEDAAVAVFQDLIVEKSRSFEIKGGRTYANETLADSLYAVFNELGSNRPQQVNSFMPATNADPDGLLLDEQLDLNEVARVRDAVRSLIGDLERGRAFLSRDTSADTFTWRDDAARAFRYVRQLEKHEETLIAELQRHAALAAPLDALWPGAPYPQQPMAHEWEKRVAEVREASEPMSADAAAAEWRSVSDRYSTELLDAFNLPLAELRNHGFVFEPVGQGLGGSLYFVRPSWGDPRLSPISPRGGVLLAFGETETLFDDVWSFIHPENTPSLGPLNRAALVHVVHTVGNVGDEVNRRHEQWKQSLTQRAGANPELRLTVDVVALVDPSRDFSGLSCGQRIAAALAGFGAWASIQQRPYEPIPGEIPLLAEPLAEWIASDLKLLYFTYPPPHRQFRLFAERDALEHDGRVVLNLGAQIKKDPIFASVSMGCMLNGFGQTTGSPDLWAPLGRWLLSEGRVVLYVDWEGKGGWTSSEVVELLDVGARVIILISGALPLELKDFPQKGFSAPPV